MQNIVCVCVTLEAPCWFLRSVTLYLKSYGKGGLLKQDYPKGCSPG